MTVPKLMKCQSAGFSLVAVWVRGHPYDLMAKLIGTLVEILLEAVDRVENVGSMGFEVAAHDSGIVNIFRFAVRREIIFII